MGPVRTTDLTAKCKLFGYLSIKEYDVERCVSRAHFLMAQIGWVQLTEKINDSSFFLHASMERAKKNYKIVFFRTSTLRVNQLSLVKGRLG